MSKINGFGLGLLMVPFMAQLSGCAAAGGIKPSQATCNQFLTQMQSHKYQVAYGLFDTKSKNTVSAKQLQSAWESAEKNRGKVNSWTQQGIKFYSGTSGSNVRLSYSLRCAKGVSNATFVCVPEGSKWLIQGANFTG